MIIGPVDTLYEGGFIRARLKFPEDYPQMPPTMTFLTELWHPSIYDKPRDKKGELCISILHAPGKDQYGFERAEERWLPIYDVEKILIAVTSLLSADKPSIDSPANVDAAIQIREDFEGYKRRVRQLVRRSAEE